VVRRTTPAAGVATSCQTFLLDPPGGTSTFHAGSPSFYYARVLQLPTSRWSVFDCRRAPNANPTDCAAGGKLNVQIAERAWTSPAAATIVAMTGTSIGSIGDLALRHGGRLRDARLAYVTYGTLAPDGRNAVLLTHGYTSSHLFADESAAEGSWSALVGPGRTI